VNKVILVYRTPELLCTFSEMSRESENVNNWWTPRLVGGWNVTNVSVQAHLPHFIIKIPASKKRVQGFAYRFC
jgi:hypothetical protein